MTAATTAVVGAGGFIGSALVRALCARSVPCLAFTRATPPVGVDGSLAPGLAGVGTIVWAAASINPAIAESSPDRVADDHHALLRLVEALAAAGSTARLVYLSSGGTVYDPSSPAPHDEGDRCAPQGAYGRAKLAAEAVVLAGHDPVVVRVSNAYGPGQPMAPGQGVIAHWLHSIARRRPLTIMGSTDTARDYVHVDDLVAALVAIAGAPQVPRVVNIGSGAPTTLGELLEAVQRVTGPVVVEHAPSRSFDVSRTWLDISLASRSLGWRPVVSLPAGLAGTWDVIRASLETPTPGPGA